MDAKNLTSLLRSLRNGEPQTPQIKGIGEAILELMGSGDLYSFAGQVKTFVKEEFGFQDVFFYVHDHNYEGSVKLLLLDEKDEQHIDDSFVYACSDIDVKENYAYIPLKIQDKKIATFKIKPGPNTKPETTKKFCNAMHYLALVFNTVILHQKSKDKRIVTGLADIGAFEDYLEYEFLIAKKFGRYLSLVRVDLNDFKRFNEIYGHKTADKALKNVADMLRDYKPKSAIIANPGGDEFAEILIETNLDNAIMIAEDLRKKIKGYSSNLPEQLTLSTGVASYDPEQDNFDSWEELNDAADNACGYTKMIPSKDFVSFYEDGYFYHARFINGGYEKINPIKQETLLEEKKRREDVRHIFNEALVKVMENPGNLDKILYSAKKDIKRLYQD